VAALSRLELYWQKKRKRGRKWEKGGRHCPILFVYITEKGGRERPELMIEPREGKGKREKPKALVFFRQSLSSGKIQPRAAI